MNVLDKVAVSWGDICHGIFSLWPNCYLQPYLLKTSGALADHIWPLDPKNETIYGNFQNLGKTLYFYTTFATMILLAEIFLVFVIVKKIRKGLKGQ